MVPDRWGAQAKQTGELRLGKRALSEQSQYFSPHRVVKEARIIGVPDTSNAEPFLIKQRAGSSHAIDLSSRLDVSFYLSAIIPFYSILVQDTRAELHPCRNPPEDLKEQKTRSYERFLQSF